MSDQKKRVGLVIGSGGVKCAAAIGLLSVMRDEGIDIDIAVGCSGGSLYVASIALGYELSQLEDLTLKFWTPDIMKDYS
jgi:NTE family protein